MSAAEWNDFTDRINQFLQYKGLASVSFTIAPYSDGQFYAFMYNQARNAITSLPYSVSPPPVRNSGDIIYASEINALRNSLNSVS